MKAFYLICGFTIGSFIGQALSGHNWNAAVEHSAFVAVGIGMYVAAEKVAA